MQGSINIKIAGYLLHKFDYDGDGMKGTVF